MPDFGPEFVERIAAHAAGKILGGSGERAREVGFAIEPPCVRNSTHTVVPHCRRGVGRTWPGWLLLFKALIANNIKH
jgi:hypothetical protein